MEDTAFFEYRATAKTNVLLQHSPLGHAPPSTYTLPDETFRYGIRSKPGESVKLCFTGWDENEVKPKWMNSREVHPQRPKTAIEKPRTTFAREGYDCIKTNPLGADTPLTTSGRMRTSRGFGTITLDEPKQNSLKSEYDDDPIRRRADLSISQSLEYKTKEDTDTEKPEKRKNALQSSRRKINNYKPSYQSSYHSLAGTKNRKY